MLATAFLCWIGLVTAGGELINCIKAPRYVTPNDTTVCTCSNSVSTRDPTPWYVYWEDPSGEDVVKSRQRWGVGTLTLDLTTDVITRDADGKNFSCYFVYGPRRSLLNTYTPAFAYGPDNVTITGTRTVRRDVITRQQITFTCSATVKPTAAFQWQGYPKGAVITPGSSCQGYTFSSTLTFDADLYQGGEVIACTVNNTVAEWHKSQRTEVTLLPQSPSGQGTDPSVYIGVTVTMAALLVFSLLGNACLWKRRRAGGNPGVGPVPQPHGGGAPVQVSPGDSTVDETTRLVVAGSTGAIN